MKIRKLSSSVALICSMLGCVSAANGGSFDISLVNKFSTGDQCVPGTVPVQNINLSKEDLTSVPAPMVRRSSFLKPNFLKVPIPNCSLGTKLKVAAGSSYISTEANIPTLNEDGTFASSGHPGAIFEVVGSNGVLGIAPYARNQGHANFRAISPAGHKVHMDNRNALVMGYSVALRNNGTPRGIDSLTPDEYTATVAVNITML